MQPGESPGFLLWHATLRWQRGIATALTPLDLTHVQFVLLACTWWLNGQGEHPSQQALARQAGTDVKMTSQVVRTLEAKGLVEREVDPADSRARRLRVTAAGAELAPGRSARSSRWTRSSSARSPAPRWSNCSAGSPTPRAESHPED
ncbi:MarR family winged helix-turn-helix transcriptional regulator [Kitasatospora gansuensis]